MSKIALDLSFLIYACSCCVLKRTAEADIIVVVKLVDCLELSTDVVLLDLGVQVLDGGVLWVTAEDELGLLLPGISKDVRNCAILV